jgi:hypothetical protein
MSDDERKPVDDLKEGLGLIFKAAKGTVEKLPKGKLEHVVKEAETVARDAAKEVGRAFESIGNEIDKAFGKSGPGIDSPPAAPPPPPAAHATPEQPAPATDENAPNAHAKEPVHYDDGYAPEPPKGPRVG